ncbi:VLRF1 family aeRF1-type release factor [Lentibacillus halophilus]|uniref:VLRF1 family aeRF1-type release factor n=1 Tax=Lentibacillus halophilus TaxID=295065 RepID=A0ABN0ZAJ6_9BACI
MLIKDYLKQLKNTTYDEPKKVFTLYLNTDPRDPDQQGDKWKIQLKKALNDLADRTKDSDSHEEKNQAKSIREKVENDVYGKENELKRSLILFATSDEDLWFSEALDVPVTTEYHWDNQPHTEQLQNLVSDYPHSGVLVIQQDRAQLIETEIDMVLDTTYYKLDMNTDEWRQHQGPQGSDWTQGGAKKDEYQERVEAHQQRWFKSLAETIQKKGKQQGWEQLQLVGEKEEIERLKDYFDWEINKMIPRNLLDQNPSQILTDVFAEE